MQDQSFHLQRFFFQVLKVDGRFQAWKDTYNVLRNGKIKVAWLPDDRPGQWLYHCHILYPAIADRMTPFEIVPKDAMIVAFSSPSIYQHAHH